MFRTELHIEPSEKKISLDTPVLSVGSCFSDNIGQLLQSYKFDIISNPFGVIFNPISNNKLLRSSIQNDPASTDGYLQNQDIHLHYDFHSQFGSANQGELENTIKSATTKTHIHLKKVKWLIITWGTAIVYERKDTGGIVANCHKVPAAQFGKRVLTQKEIIHDFEQLLKSLSPDIQVLLTVSPVRHIKETLELNSVSKSTLRIASHSLVNQHKNVHYFPSYEMMMDDLRDYRFYKSDMLHPTDEAIKYIWGKFAVSYFDQSTLEFVDKWEKIMKAINHKPFNVHSKSHQQFIQNTISEVLRFEDKVDIVNEVNQLKGQLI